MCVVSNIVGITHGPYIYNMLLSDKSLLRLYSNRQVSHFLCFFTMCNNTTMAFKMRSPFTQSNKQFKSKVKTRGDKTIIKTKEKGSNYRSKIVLNEDGDVVKAKSNTTNNKSKKDPRRTKRSKWINRDLAGYRGVQKEIKKQQDELYGIR